MKKSLDSSVRSCYFPAQSNVVSVSAQAAVEISLIGCLDPLFLP